MLGPVPDLLNRALDLAAGHRDRTADLGDQHPPEPLLVALERVVQLSQAVVAEVQIARPVGLVERPPGGSDGPLHVGDGAVGGLARDLLAGRVDHVEFRTAVGELQFAVDEHPLLAGQHPGFVLHGGHFSWLLFIVGYRWFG